MRSMWPVKLPMNNELSLRELVQQSIAKLRSVEAALTLLTLLLIAAFHGAAAEDRFLSILYYIGIVGSAYALVMRRAFALMVLVLSVAAGTTLATVFFTTQAENWDPLLDPVRDLAALFVLLYLACRLGIEAYRFQTEEQKRELRRHIEEKTIEMRARALTSTSHEVRTPLSAILAINETLLSESAGSLNDVQKDFLQDIEEAAQHLMNLVNDILDYAKAEAGMIELSPEPVALLELVEQCIAMVQPRAEKARVNITAQVSPDIKEIVADPLRLKQILLNLLSNAVKFNEKHGIVNVRVRMDKDDVVISVRDTGRGISAEQLENLFDPYYQAARGDQGIGTGLGLSIIKHLAELHGGSINVESVPGRGSVFTIRLPSTGSVTVAQDESLLQSEDWDTMGASIRSELDDLQELSV